MLGQNVLGFQDNGILVVTNAGEDTDFQESRYFEIVSRYFGGAFPASLPEDPAALSGLEETVRRLSDYSRPRDTIGPLGDPFLHRSFAVRDQRAPSTGLLPLALQVLHNNYTAGITSIAVSVRGGLPELLYRERDAVHRFPVGLGQPVITELRFRGDCYQTAVLGRFTHDEEERPVFVVRLEFLETPCTRTLKLILDRDGLLLRQTETPGVPYVYGKLAQAAAAPLYKPLLLMAAGGVEEDFLLYKTLQILSPELRFVQE